MKFTLIFRLLKTVRKQRDGLPFKFMVIAAGYIHEDTGTCSSQWGQKRMKLRHWVMKRVHI